MTPNFIGIGRQIVQRLHDDGATVYVIDRNPDLVELLHQELPNVKAVEVDITDWAATQKAIEAFGPLDHLVNNAGVLKSEEFMKISEESASMYAKYSYFDYVHLQNQTPFRKVL